MSISLNYWVRPSQKNAKKKAPIYLNINCNGLKCQHSTGIAVNLGNWEKKSQRIKGASLEVEALNGKLVALKARALKVYNELLLSGEDFNTYTIKDKLINGLSKSITFDELMDEHIDVMKTLKGRAYSQPTIIKYRSSQKRVTEFVKKKYRRNHIYLYELDYAFIDSFSNFLKVEFNNSNTTIYKHFQRISRVVRIGVNKGYINHFPFGEFKIKMDKPPLVYLTFDEVKKIEQKVFKISRLELVKKVFLLSCYSGLSFKELENLQPKNLINSDEGIYWLSMTRQKTKRSYRVVLLPQAYSLIQDLQEFKHNIKPGKLIPMLSNQKYNSYLKEIADACKIDKRLTSHVGRKTFSIGIAMRSNVSIELLSALLGHSSIRVTTDYYTKITDEIMLEGVKNLGDHLKKL